MCFKFLKKTISICLIGLGVRNISGIITSFVMVVIYIRSRYNYLRICMYILLKRIGEWWYEYCSKKSSEMFKGNSQASFWNKGLNTYLYVIKNT